MTIPKKMDILGTETSPVYNSSHLTWYTLLERGGTSCPRLTDNRDSSVINLFTVFQGADKNLSSEDSILRNGLMCQGEGITASGNFAPRKFLTH